MKRSITSLRSFSTALLATGAFFSLCMTGAPSAMAEKTPALVVTNEPLPPELHNKIYSGPQQIKDITPRDIIAPSYYEGQQTIVGKKVTNLRQDLTTLQGEVSALSKMLASLEARGQTEAAEYYASVGTISAQLQSGTTPGNPRLIAKLNDARANLEDLSENIAALQNLSVEVSNAASMAAFLLEAARATYNLSGAVEEDHIRLAQMEDGVTSTMVVIDRLLNNVSDDISRTVAYLATERENLQTLTLAINTGDLFGRSLANKSFAMMHKTSTTAPGRAMAPVPGDMMGMPAAMPPAAPLDGPRPLVKIRFDRPDVAYEQPVYMAVNEALSRYPNARFEIVAVHPSGGNAAQVAIESTRARRNADRVLRSLTQMGLGVDRVDLSYTPSQAASTSEVHLYVR